LTSAAMDDEQDNYYGARPLNWSDLVVDAEQGVLLSRVVACVPHPTAGLLLTHLLQDCPSRQQELIAAVRPYWSHWTVAMAAPHNQETNPSVVVTLCATVIRQDITAYASDYLTALTLPRLAQLLQSGDNDVLLAAVSILESLTSREDAAVAMIFSDQVSAATLLSLLVQRIHTIVAMVTTSVPSIPNNAHTILTVALQVLANMAVACQGQYVATILEHSLLLHSLTCIIDGRITVEVLSLVGCLLCDAGIPNHASTTIGVPALMGSVVDVLVSINTAVFAWQRDAACAIQVALVQPPPTATYSNGSGDDSFVLATTLGNLLEQYLWRVPERRQVLIRSLLDLSRRRDAEAELAAWQILDRLLRTIPGSRRVFEELGGVDQLEAMTLKQHSHIAAVATISTLATNLMDDLFDDTDDNDDDDDNEYMTEHHEDGTIEDDSFCLANKATATDSFGESHPVMRPFGTTAGNPPPAGRGRGRTMPAWMQSSQVYK
jgi:hypothetical protein